MTKVSIKSITHTVPTYDRQYPYLCVEFSGLFESTYKKVTQYYFPYDTASKSTTLSYLLTNLLIRELTIPRYLQVDKKYLAYHTLKSADTIRDILYPQLLEGRRVTAPRLIRLIDAEIAKLITTLTTAILI